MPANRVNYLVVYRGEPQVYGTAKKEVALTSPPPEGVPIEDKFVFFITHQPDSESISLHAVDREEIENAEIKR